MEDEAFDNMDRQTDRPAIQNILRQAEEDIRQGRLADAEKRYRNLLKQIPDDSRLHLTLGLLYLEQKEYHAAKTQIERAIGLDPDNPNAFSGLGDVLAADGNLDAAIEAYEKACDLNPMHVQALLGLGNALQQTDRYEDALASYGKVLKIEPYHPRALNNIGKTFYDLGLLENAIHYYASALERIPDYAEAHFNRSVARIALGDFAGGWKEYEWRFKRSMSHEVYPHHLPTPRWQGENYERRKLLVHCEQGFGDVLQFARYLPEVKKRGGQLIFQVHPPLLPLMESLPCVDALVPLDLEKPPSVRHDLHVPLLSIPHVLGTTPETIPNRFPYLTPDPRKIRYFRNQLTEAGLRVGLVWASSPLNHRRNFPIVRAQDWFRIPGITYYSLQLGPEADHLRSLDPETPIRELGAQLTDFGETAALVANLDLVISVDTAIAHLAGALGKPLWMLLPHMTDWRWPTHLPRSPWYPDARIFRQFRLDSWDNVAGEVSRALAELTASRGRQEAVPPVPGSPPESTKTVQMADSDGPSPPVSFVKSRKILLVSPLLGGSLEVIRYLTAGFQQAGQTTLLIDNSRYHTQYRQIDEGPGESRHKEAAISRMLTSLDDQLLVCADRFKPDVVMAVAQSPLENQTVRKLRKKGIVCAYWFVEDYRFREYWSEIATAYDLFFTIQRDDHLKARFTDMGYSSWHYLPLACEPTVHKPWSASELERQAYQCQIGFMGAPYLNRLRIFEELKDYDLKIWGEGWSDYEMSQALKACVQDGGKRTSPEDTVKIYSCAEIAFNLHSSPFVEEISAAGEFVNPRTFEIAGCAGFQLADYRHELPLLFEPGKEIILFHNLDELHALVKYWLPRPRQRAQIAHNAQSRAYSQHTYRHRAGQILKHIEKA